MGEEAVIPTKDELLEAIDGEAEETSVEEGKEEETTHEYTEVEEEALTHGWKPDGVEGRRTLTAEEFMDRQPLYDEIRTLKRQTRKLQDGMEALTQHQKNIRKQEREQTIRELKQQKVEALEAQDHVKVVELDDKIQDTKAEAVVEDEPANEDFEEWVETNTWYNQDDNLRFYANTIGAGYAKLHPDKSLSDVYAHVSKEVKARFPDKFPGARRGKPNAVEAAGKGRKQGKQSKHSVKDLPEEERTLMRTILRATPDMTEQDYLSEYFKYQ